MSDSDPIGKEVRNATADFRAAERKLLDAILEETERRNQLNKIIEETERRLYLEELKRKTPAQKSLIRSLKSKLSGLTTQVQSVISNINDNGSRIQTLRREFRTKIASIMKGVSAGTIVEIALAFLRSALTEALRKEIDQRKDQENKRRCISDSLNSMPSCFGKGARTQDRKKSNLRIDGKEANTHDLIGQMVRATTQIYNREVAPSENPKYGYPQFAHAWLNLMTKFYEQLEEAVDSGILEREKPFEDQYEWYTTEDDVDVCQKKKKGEAIDIT